MKTFRNQNFHVQKRPETERETGTAERWSRREKTDCSRRVRVKARVEVRRRVWNQHMLREIIWCRCEAVVRPEPPQLELLWHWGPGLLNLSLSPSLTHFAELCVLKVKGQVCYCCYCCCKDRWIIFIFLRVTKNNTGYSQVYSVILFIIEMNHQSTFLRFVKAENLSIASLRELLVLVFGVWFSVKFQICPFHRKSLSDLCFTWRVWMKDDLLNQRVWSSADLRAFVFSQISLTSSGPWTGSWWSIPPRRAASDTSPLGYTR